jgi:hypothetical protein
MILARIEGLLLKEFGLPGQTKALRLFIEKQIRTITLRWLTFP